MQNPFRIKRSKLLSLFNEFRGKSIAKIIRHFGSELSDHEMSRQIIEKTGPVHEAAEAFYKKFGSNTDNIEIMTSLSLSDFYFDPLSDPELEFEMRRDFKAKAVWSYEELTKNLDKNTYIDACVSLGTERYVFQIKGYDERWFSHTNKEIVKRILEIVDGYGSDMHGTILLLTIQPKAAYARTSLDFNKLTSDLEPHKEKISFDEVLLVYTDGGTNSTVLQRILPTNTRKDIDLNTMLARMRGDL